MVHLVVLCKLNENVSQKLLEENLTLVRGNVLVARLHHVRRVFVSGQLQ